MTDRLQKSALALLASAAVLSGCSSYCCDNFMGEGPLVSYPAGREYNPETGENYADYSENPFLSVADQPQSTFSVDADGGSFANMRSYVSRFGSLPPKNAIRIEEFLNYFTFDYPEPSNGETVSLDSEISACPWAEGHQLLRVGIRGKQIPEAELPLQNFVYLIDVSGSMEGEDRLELLKKGFNLMTDQMRPKDRVSIVTYAGNAGILLRPTYGDQKNTIRKAVDRLEANGSTAGYNGISTAYKLAEECFVPGGNNRIIIGSDGDFNVGASTIEELVELIEEKRDKGIYLTVIGVGRGNLNDAMMEQIANKGNGNYEYIDNLEQLEKVFINEKSKFLTVAKDSKIQITFNPETVSRYRLLGYENRLLTNEEFEDDSTDAGEIGAGQTITALYELIPTEAGISGGSAGTFDFRYKVPEENRSRELSVSLSAAKEIPSAADASENQRFAAAVASCALVLRESEYAGTASIRMAKDLASSACFFDPFGYRDRFISLLSRIEDLKD